jgi:hypothetical protein
VKVRVLHNDDKYVDNIRVSIVDVVVLEVHLKCARQGGHCIDQGALKRLKKETNMMLLHSSLISTMTYANKMQGMDSKPHFPLLSKMASNG